MKMNDLDQYLSRPDNTSRLGVKPIHFRIAANVKDNPRLPPGVRVNDMPYELVIEQPPSEGDHDLSSGLEDQNGNPRSIFDLSDFYNNPNYTETRLWQVPRYRDWLRSVSQTAINRDYHREMTRRNIPNIMRRHEQRMKEQMLRQRLREDTSDSLLDRDREYIMNERMNRIRTIRKEGQGDTNRFGRQGPVGHSVLPPPHLFHKIPSIIHSLFFPTYPTSKSSKNERVLFFL